MKSWVELRDLVSTLLPGHVRFWAARCPRCPPPCFAPSTAAVVLPGWSSLVSAVCRSYCNWVEHNFCRNQFWRILALCSTSRMDGLSCLNSASPKHSGLGQEMYQGYNGYQCTDIGGEWDYVDSLLRDAQWTYMTANSWLIQNCVWSLKSLGFFTSGSTNNRGRFTRWICTRD